MNIIDNHFLLTTHQEQILRQSASLPFNLGGFTSLDDILTTLGVDVFIEPGIIKSSGHPLGRNKLLDRILDYWENELQRLRKKMDQGYNEKLHEGNNIPDFCPEIQEVEAAIDRIKKEKQYVGGTLLRGYYNPKDNSIHLFPEEMATEYNGKCMDELLVSTLAHETMHAYFNRPGHDKFPYAYFVEEPLAEFGMLLYLHETMPGFYNWAHNDVSGKRTCYSLGAELMDQYMKSYPYPTRADLEAYKIKLRKEAILLPTSGKILKPKASKKSGSTKPTSASRKYYTINGTGNYTMYDVVEEFIKFRLDAGLSIPDIDNEIKSYIYSKGSSKVYISGVSSTVYIGTRGYARVLNYKGNVVYYTNQWSDGIPSDNFRKFRVGVSNDPKFSGHFVIK